MSFGFAFAFGLRRQVSFFFGFFRAGRFFFFFLLLFFGLFLRLLGLFFCGEFFGFHFFFGFNIRFGRLFRFFFGFFFAAADDFFQARRPFLQRRLQLRGDAVQFFDFGADRADRVFGPDAVAAGGKLPHFFKVVFDLARRRPRQQLGIAAATAGGQCHRAGCAEEEGEHQCAQPHGSSLDKGVGSIFPLHFPINGRTPADRRAPAVVRQP